MLFTVVCQVILWGNPDSALLKLSNKNEFYLFAPGKIKTHSDPTKSFQFPKSHKKHSLKEIRTKYEKATFCNPSKKLLNKIACARKTFCYPSGVPWNNRNPKNNSESIHLNRWKFSSLSIKQIKDNLGKREFPPDSVCLIVGFQVDDIFLKFCHLMDCERFWSS